MNARFEFHWHRSSPLTTSRCRKSVLTLVVGFASLLAAVNLADAQPAPIDEMKISAKVAELQIQLEDADLALREAAEKQIIDLGTSALQYLAPVNDDTSTETIQRISRIRKALESAAVTAFTQPQRVTLQGTFTIKDAIEAIAKQSKNQVVWPAGAEDAVATTEIQLDVNQASFWQAVDAVSRKASMTVDSFNSRPGEIMLVPTGPSQGNVPVDSSSIFQVSVLQVVATRNLENPELNYCGVRVRIRWEPRLAPIRLGLPASQIRVIDEYDQQIQLPNPDAILSAAVQPEIPEVEIVIPIGLVDRQVDNISQLHATIQATLPGRSESFNFQKIGRLQAGFRQSKAGVSVVYEGFEKNEDLYGVKVSFHFDDAAGALESHLGWVYENPLYLIAADGQKRMPLTQESAGRTANSIAIRYYFSEDPAAMNLHCQTPAAIVSTDVKISLKDIPLP